MTVTKLLRPTLAATLLASVTATMPDAIGGNAGRAYERMGSKLDMTFKDAGLGVQRYSG